MLVYLFFILIALIVYIWLGYFIIIYILNKILPKKKFLLDENFQPFVSIIISVFNEGEVIEERIKNLFELNYPGELMEIIITSDGSTDDTVKIARYYESQGIKVLDFGQNRGTAMVYNDVINLARGEILVFTDADTIFDHGFVKNIVKPFADSRVGAATGRLFYKTRGDAIAEDENRYWKYETRIRIMESNLGLLNNASGACMAFRKSLYKKLTPVDHIDTATIIDIILQGYKVVLWEDAVAYDIPPRRAKSEFNVRVRGTSKTLTSLTKRTNIWTWLKNPVLLFTVLSRRMGRYFTPYLLLVVFILNFFLLKQGIVFQAIFVIQMLFYLAVVVGWLADRKKQLLPICSNCYSFFVAMLGMFVGVLRAITGRVPVTFKTDDTL